MKSKEEIVEILIGEFSSVYCDTCNGEYCDECHRKAMNWGISKGCAEDIAKQILGK